MELNEVSFRLTVDKTMAKHKLVFNPEVLSQTFRINQHFDWDKQVEKSKEELEREREQDEANHKEQELYENMSKQQQREEDLYEVHKFIHILKGKMPLIGSHDKGSQRWFERFRKIKFRDETKHADPVNKERNS